VLGAMGAFTADGVEVRDARELRVKESDRIAVLAKALRALGATVEEFEDGFRVPGQQRLRGAAVDPAGDHRIAMAAAVAALGCDGDTTIHGADCVAISFPGFFELMERVAVR